MALLKYVVMLHKDVPRAAKFYSDGLGLTVHVCTNRWAELQSGPFKLGLMQTPSEFEPVKNYSSYLSFDVTNLDSTITKLLGMGAELDGPIKHEIHGKDSFMYFPTALLIAAKDVWVNLGVQVGHFFFMLIFLSSGAAFLFTRRYKPRLSTPLRAKDVLCRFVWSFLQYLLQQQFPCFQVAAVRCLDGHMLGLYEPV